MGQNRLKVSWWLTWGNLIISTFGFAFLLSIGVFRKPDLYTGATLCIILLLLSWVSLVILQNLPNWYNFCCDCCQTKCFPVIQETILDVERPLEVIEWPLIEHDEEEIELLEIHSNQAEAISKVLDFQCGHIKNDFICISCQKNLQPMKRSYTF